MALTYAPNCSLLVNNTAGNVQSLPTVAVGGKERTFTEKIAITQLAIADQIMVARIPYGSIPLEINVNSSISLSNAQISFGDKNNTSRFAAAGTFTSTATPTPKMDATVGGVPLTTCYDNAGVSSTQYEDILMTIGVSSIAAGGTLMIVTRYIDYGA